MATFKITIFSLYAIAYSFLDSISTAFTATSLCQKTDATALIGLKWSDKYCQQKGRIPIVSLNMLDSSPDPDIPNDEVETNNDLDGGPSMSLPTSYVQPVQQQQPETPAAYVPPPPTPTQNSPPAARQQPMDPLMASLTRDTSNTSLDQPMQNIPLFGEIPADGTLLLLVPAVVSAVLGIIYSIVIAFNSSDQIVDSIMQTGDSISQNAVKRNNQVYDKNVCRGLCSSQQDDIEGLRNFMEAITRNAREGK